MGGKKHFPIVTGRPETDQGRWYEPDYLCVGFFLLCCGVWLVFSPALARAVSMIANAPPMTSRNPDASTGMAFFAGFIFVVSMPCLLVAFMLSVFALHLPKWFRILSVLPTLSGVLTGVGIFLALLWLTK